MRRSLLWVALGGGGYEWVDVVPRAWSHLIGEVVGAWGVASASGALTLWAG